MKDLGQRKPSRREFLKSSSQAAVSSTLILGAARHVHASEDNTIRVALVGCGGRGTGAAFQALSVKRGPIKLVAMADVFEDKLHLCKKELQKRIEEHLLPEGNGVFAKDHEFIGFDAYQEAMDCLKPGDVVILATPPAFRWVHFTYAIQKGLNVFMEKPITVDGPTSLKMLQLGKQAEEKNLKVGVGLMCRHCKARQALADRIHSGDIGDVLSVRAYRMAGPTGSAEAGPRPESVSELTYQIRNFHAFLWASGGAVSDFLIHNIDEGCWAKGEWPVRASATGGRHYRHGFIDQNFDHYSIEYTFGDGAKMHVDGRTMGGCHSKFATYVHGTKGSAIFSTSAHYPAKSRIYKRQKFDKNDLVWEYSQPETPHPWQREWDDLIDAIRDDNSYSEVERGVVTSAVTSMGRMAAHTGQIITYDAFIRCAHEFAPQVDELTLDGPAPIQADRDGKYPIPMPGILMDREYEA